MRTNSIVLSMFLLGGCASNAALDDAASAGAALDSSDDTSTEGAVLAVATDPISTAMTPGEAAGSASATAHTYYQPSTCVTSTALGPVVTYQLDDCTGPFGLVHVTGTIVVTYSLALDGLHANAVAHNLAVNGATLDVNANGLYTVSGTTKKLSVTTAGSGTGPRGHAISRAGQYTITWDPATGCGTLDGAWSTDVNGATWSTTVSGYQRCSGQCPAAGGELTHVGGLSHLTVNIAFDGSADAAWSTSNGVHGTIALLCQ